MGLRRYGPLLSRAAAMASILLAEIMVRGTLLGDAQTQLDYFPLPSQLYRLLLAWGGALAILTAVERSSWVAPVTANLAGRPPQTAWLIAHFMLIAPVVLPGVLDPLSGNAPVVLQQIIQHVLFGAAVLSL